MQSQRLRLTPYHASPLDGRLSRRCGPERLQKGAPEGAQSDRGGDPSHACHSSGQAADGHCGQAIAGLPKALDATLTRDSRSLGQGLVSLAPVLKNDDESVPAAGRLAFCGAE